MPGWLVTATLLLLIQLTEMRPGDHDHHNPPNIRHHHRHKHKHSNIMSDLPYEDTFFDSFKEMVIEKDMMELSHFRTVKNDWVNMSSDQVGELKDKKHHPHWPIKREAVIEGDLVIGGLMMVHERSDSMTCGPVMPQGGVQALETMLYTLDIVNNELQLIPGVTIGAHVLDDCDKDTYGLEMAVDFIKGSISNIDDAEYACNATAVRKVISGVVGAASSVTSVQVANLLRLFKIPQVSFFSTSPELSNKARFEYFTRTIPSDLHQVRAMVEIVKKLGWSYVSIIYEESSYGIKAFEELEALLARSGICIAVKEKLVKDSGVADERAYDDIVQKLLTKPRARGAIIFGSDQEVAGVMRAVERGNATNLFSWVGSDGWSARSLVSDGNERAVEGTISVQPQANDVKGFTEYFLALNVKNNKRNPWFVELWEAQFQCRYPGSPRTPYNGHFERACSGFERLTIDNTEFERQLQFVSDAVLAFAYAIRDMHAAVCGGRPGLCDAMRPASGADLLRYLRKVNFTGLSGDEFHFDSNGDGPARYNILHFKQVQQGVYRWVNVGQYLDGELQLELDDIQFKWYERRPPESVCSAECELGQAKQYVEGESCCWHCFNCTQYEIRSPYVETACMVCPRGTLPDPTRTHCRPIPEAYLRPDSAWAIGAMSFSSVGILLTAFVCGVWVRHSSTPVVRASGRELSYVLLAGILMCYLVTFALVFRPTDILCSIQRFGTGFCFTVVYAALLTKTNRISRIFNASKHSAKRPILISPSSQLAICAALISIQVLIVVVWMIVAPARAMFHYPTREDNMLVCDSYVDASYMIAFFYPIVLILVCTVYAVLTRKIPEAFNESKHIGFTMYTTCVIWLAFVPLYFGTASHVPLRVTSMAVTISLSASVTLVCLFSPKLETDMENYTQYKIMGSVKQIRMRPNCIPSRFDCQDRKHKSTPSEPRQAFIKRQRMSTIKEIEEAIREENDVVSLPSCSQGVKYPIPYGKDNVNRKWLNTISLSTSVTLVCLFSPKLYIILIRPERNVRQSIMPVRYSRKPPPQHALPAAQIKKASCADKETQTEAADFNKLSNGQTIQRLQDNKEGCDNETNAKEEKESNQCNNITPAINNPKEKLKLVNNPSDNINNVNITNERAGTL